MEDLPDPRARQVSHLLVICLSLFRAEKLMADFAESASALTLQEPGVSSSEEILRTRSLEESIATGPWTLPKTPLTAALRCQLHLLGRKFGSGIVRICIRMDLGGAFWMYPDLGGPFQSLKEAEYAINHYLEELQRRARCRQGELSTVDRIIHDYKYYHEKHYLVQALLEQYNEDRKLSGNPTYELEGLVAQQWLYEDQDHRWYYHFNFTAKKKEADGSSTCNLFFAEVSNIKAEHACEVDCCRMIEHGNRGDYCYGCKNNGSPEMRHPSDTDAYTTGHLDGYLPFGLESSSSDEDESKVRLRAMFKDRDDPDYWDKIRRLTPGKGMN
ncbi:hypothetical protein EJB05_46530, partial [Eragrostis curvula]